MKIQELRYGQMFRFASQASYYVSLGDGWYDAPKPYDSCPACVDADTDVIPVKTTKIRELRYGQQFRFPYATTSVYVSLGNGWYGTPAGYDGGPWHADADTDVIPVDDIADQWEDYLADRAEKGLPAH